MGAYGLSGWRTQARATEDVGVIVALKHVKKAAIALLKEFPFLEEDEQEVVVRLQDVATHDVLIDLMKPTRPLLRAIFKNTKTVEIGKQKYRIPSCEMALALKFAPMISLARQDKKKLVDAHDFIDCLLQFSSGILRLKH